MEIRRPQDWEIDEKDARTTKIGVWLGDQFGPDFLLTNEELIDLHSEIFKFLLKELHNQLEKSHSQKS